MPFVDMRKIRKDAILRPWSTRLRQALCFCRVLILALMICYTCFDFRRRRLSWRQARELLNSMVQVTLEIQPL